MNKVQDSYTTGKKTVGGRDGGACEGVNCKRKEIIPILALLEKTWKLLLHKEPLELLCLPKFLLHSLQLLVYGRSSIFVLYEQSAS